MRARACPRSPRPPERSRRRRRRPDPSPWSLPTCTAHAPAATESKELLTYCIKRVKGLQKVKLVDASFIWTEPHSMRIKAKLTVQAEVLNGAILQQAFVVEYVVERHMCPTCNRQNANPNAWVACVQVCVGRVGVGGWGGAVGHVWQGGAGGARHLSAARPPPPHLVCPSSTAPLTHTRAGAPARGPQAHLPAAGAAHPQALG